MLKVFEIRSFILIKLIINLCNSEKNWYVNGTKKMKLDVISK